MKTKMPLLFLIPMIAIILVVAGAALVRMLSRPATEVAQTTEYPSLDESTNKPSSFLGKLFGGGTTPAPTPASSDDLARELKNTVDDGGQSDFDALEKESEGL